MKVYFFIQFEYSKYFIFWRNFEIVIQVNNLVIIIYIYINAVT